MRTFPTHDSTKCPLRISQIDCLSQNREDAGDFEQKRERERLNKHQEKIMSQAPAIADESYGRKKSKFPGGVLPPISQISMGGRQICDDTTDTTLREGLKLPPISQVSCLGGCVDDSRLIEKTGKKESKECESEFVKLCRAGGQKNLLHYVEAKSIVRGTESFPVSKGGRVGPGFTSEADPRWKPSHWSEFTRRGQMRGGRKLIWR